MTTAADQNREAWLTTAARALAEWFSEVEDAEVPPFRVSVGWPGGRGPKSSVRGQCWPTCSAEDGVAQIFISPTQVDTETTLGILLHEMIHAVDDCASGHRGNFVRIAKALGFVSKYTSSTNRTDELTERLQGLAERLGDFPSAAIVTGRAADTPAKQGTRMLKVVCPEDGYTLRTTQKWLDIGLPTCPCGIEMEQA